MTRVPLCIRKEFSALFYAYPLKDKKMIPKIGPNRPMEWTLTRVPFCILTDLLALFCAWLTNFKMKNENCMNNFLHSIQYPRWKKLLLWLNVGRFVYWMNSWICELVNPVLLDFQKKSAPSWFFCKNNTAKLKFCIQVQKSALKSNLTLNSTNSWSTKFGATFSANATFQFANVKENSLRVKQSFCFFVYMLRRVIWSIS